MAAEFNWQKAMAPIGGAMSSLFGLMDSPPSYQGASMAYPSFSMPAAATAQLQPISFNPSLFDVSSSPMYQMLNQGVQSVQNGGTLLPQSYLTAVRSQANQGLGLARDRANDAAAFDANKYGLLGSGSMAVRQGLNDEAYQRGMADVENSLVQQEFQNRNSQLSMLQNLLGQQASTSKTQNEMQYQTLSDNQKYSQQNIQNAMRNYEMQWKAQQEAYQAAQQQAQQQYQAQMAQWQAKASDESSLFGNLATLAGLFF